MGFAVAPFRWSTAGVAAPSALRATLDVPACSRGRYRRSGGTANDADESCRRVAMDALARFDGSGTPCCRKHLLLCLSFQLCATAGAPDPAGPLVLAQVFAFKMDCDRFALTLLLGLRSVQLVGHSAIHR